jgi:hypothetical protein
MKVEWKEFKQGDELPPTGEYWLVVDIGNGASIKIGSVVYSKPVNIFRTEEWGGLQDHQVTHYAKFVKPEWPI